MFAPYRSGAKSGSQVRLYGEETRQRIAEIVILRQMGFTVAEIRKGNITRKQYGSRLQTAQARRDELDRVILLLKQRLLDNNVA